MKNIFKKHGGFLRLREPAGNECEPVRTGAKAVIEHYRANRCSRVDRRRTGANGFRPSGNGLAVLALG